MNILFANYGDFSSNSLNHIGAFAGRLSLLDNACVVAVPKNPQSIAGIPAPRFIPATFEELLAKPRFFPDGRGADIVHAWTPRENVREFALAYLRLSPARLVIHLEDNEEYLTQANLGLSEEAVFSEQGMAKANLTAEALSHPLRYRFFLRTADAVTVIVPTLRCFVPSGIPTHDLVPGLDFSLYKPQAPSGALKQDLGIGPEDKVIVFTGSNTFANEDEILELYLAVGLLNKKGIPTKLVRTGHFSQQFHSDLPDGTMEHVIDLGYVEKTRLPALLALSDAAVQPGAPGPFNDYRLPSKIPELLAMGLPSVVPASNVGLELKDGVEALLLKEGSAEEIALACERLFGDKPFAEELGRAGLAFARKRYDLERIGEELLSFYQRVLVSPVGPRSASQIGRAENETGLVLRSLGENAPKEEVVRYLRELVPYLNDLEKNIHAASELAHTKETLARTERNLALARDHAAIIERERELTIQHVKNLKALIAAHQKRVGELEEQCGALESQIRELSSQNAQLSAELDRRNAKIRTMESSFSWKLTRPLRWLRRNVLRKA